MSLNINTGLAGAKETKLNRAFWSRSNKTALSRTTALPISPSDGDIYIIPDDDLINPNKIAFWSDYDDDWLLLTPEEGWVCYIIDETLNVQFDGSAWVTFKAEGAVTSVFGRSGAIVAVSGDYDASKVTFDPTGLTFTIATQVQDAIADLASYTDSLIAANDAMVFKGVIDCSVNPNYPAADRGWTYRVSVAGKIGGASGVNVEAGDVLICLDDSTGAGNQATVGSHWTIIQANLDGAVLNTRQVISGAGLTGGGDLSADRTLAVGAGEGITVNADDVALNVNGLTEDTSPDGSNDFLVTYDASASAHKKVKPENLPSAIRTVFYVIDGGGAAITTGVKGYLPIDFACTILQAEVLADQSGSIVVDIWKDSYANYPPTVADTITASAKPTLSSAIKSQDATLTGWTTSISAGDVLGFNVDSASTVTRVTVSLKVRVN